MTREGEYFTCVGCAKVHDWSLLKVFANGDEYILRAVTFVGEGINPACANKYVCTPCADHIFQPQYLLGKAIYQWRRETVGRRKGDLEIERMQS